MAMETVLLGLLGVVAVWLVIDAGRERHRLRARMDRATVRRALAEDGPHEVSAPHRQAARTSTPDIRPAEPNTGGIGPDSWRYWPLALPATDEFHR
jgi:hypothetical protein